MINVAADSSPAHRPSRRHLIVEAAVRVYARQGVGDATVQEIAEEAQVVPNAVYYHFNGKDELFAAALGDVLARIDEVTENARERAIARGGDTLKAVVDGVWDWLQEHPDEAALLDANPPGSSARSRTVWDEFEARRASQIGHFPAEARSAEPGYSAAANKAVHVFNGRLVLSLLLALRPSNADQPQSPAAARNLRRAVSDVAHSLVASA